MNVAPSARTSSYSSSVASTPVRAVRDRSTRRRTPSMSASKRCALSAMRSFTSRKSASVWARFTLSSLHRRLPSVRLPARQRTSCRRGLRSPRGELAGAGRARRRGAARAAASTRGSRSSREGRRPRRRRRDAVGCEPAQIVKSLVFVCDGLPVLALVPGDRRADAAKIAAAAGAGYARVAKPRGGARGDGLRAGRRRAVPGAARRARPDRARAPPARARLGGRRLAAAHGRDRAGRPAARLTNAEIVDLVRDLRLARRVRICVAARRREERPACKRPRRSG